MTSSPPSPPTWTLSDLLESTDSAYLEGVMAELEAHLQTLEAHRNHLTETITPETLNQILDDLETCWTVAYRLYGYAYLWFSTDTQSQAVLGFKGQVDELMLDAQNRTLFFDLWWKSLPEATAEHLQAHAGDRLYYLAQARNFTPYTLSEKEEQVINLKDVNGISGLLTVYSMITNKFSFKLTVKGEEKTLTRDELMSYVRHSDPAMREAAYEELLGVFGENQTLLGQIYAYRVRDWANEKVKLRQFDSPIAVRNLENDIPDPVVDTLLEVIAAESPLFHRYFALKAKLLNLPQLRRYDVYAPLSSTEAEIPYPTAVAMVLDTLRDFSPQVEAHARRVFDEQHIDAKIRPGKRGGAFCMSLIPKHTPYILMNYSGDVRDVATLAHELGHAIHAMLAEDHSLLTYRSALPMAETASVFTEMLLTDRLLQQESDPAVRRDILVSALDDAYATILRQAYFVLFEKEAHAAILQGQTGQELNALYMANLKQQFGPTMDIAEAFSWEWVVIPHIYRVPFYCYAYSFGQLLVMSLYQRYKEQGAEFVPDYLKILTYGGSASPHHILSEVGIDMSQADFWHGGFRVLEGMLNELESLGGAV